MFYTKPMDWKHSIVIPTTFSFEILFLIYNTGFYVDVNMNLQEKFRDLLSRKKKNS